MLRISYLLIVLLSVGCVAGPDDFASNEESDFSTIEPDATAEIKQVAAVELPAMEERGEFTTTSSGLKYRIIREGKGRKPNKTSNVTCHYKGWLDNGTVFDSSYDRGQATSFALNQVVDGWTEGIQLIQEGGAIELEIPSDLGYGDSGRPPTIPGGATLHFDVELIKVR